MLSMNGMEVLWRHSHDLELWPFPLILNKTKCLRQLHHTSFYYVTMQQWLSFTIGAILTYLACEFWMTFCLIKHASFYK